MSKVTVIGAGSFGTALSTVLAHNKHSVTLWDHDPQHVATVQKKRVNDIFLPKIKLPKNITLTNDMASAMEDPAFVLIVVPTQFTRIVGEQVKEHIKAKTPIVSTAKGLELKTGLRNSQILKSIFKSRNSIQVMSGPSHAEEVAERRPSTVCMASSNKERAQDLAKYFHNDRFRVYHSNDVVGVEIGGAVKNIIAIAAGLCDGLKLGDNSKAALLARGLVEIKRFGSALGARSSTIDGVSGLGDLVTTCFSPYGRNRKFGEMLGQGKSVAAALKIIKQVVEGLPTTESVMKEARQLKIDMPICKEVYNIVSKGKKPKDAVESLMKRSAKSEF